MLSGEITEVRVGDAARFERSELNSMPLDVDRIKPIEARVASSLSSFRITKATVGHALELPFVWHYTLEQQDYARTMGNLLLVRPRIVGSLTRGFLETKDPRRQAIEFEGPARYTDVFDIELPANCKVEELPRQSTPISGSSPITARRSWWAVSCATAGRSRSDS